MAESKHRYWLSVTYPENMVDDWETICGELLEGYPYAYCIHDKDMLGTYKQSKDEEYQRKKHVHWILAYSNTTTFNNIKNIFEKLSKPGKSCLRKGKEAIGCSNIRQAYDYLIHDTETAKKQGKYLYPSDERITGNNFDIGDYEQLQLSDKKRMRTELGKAIIENKFSNYLDFYTYVLENYHSEYEEIAIMYSGHFERLTKGNYQKGVTNQAIMEKAEIIAHDMYMDKLKSMNIHQECADE